MTLGVPGRSPRRGGVLAGAALLLAVFAALAGAAALTMPAFAAQAVTTGDGLCASDAAKAVCGEIVVTRYSDPAGDMTGSGGLLNGQTVIVADASGSRVATGVTGADGDGTVVFLLDAGKYTVSETAQPGWLATGSTVNGTPVPGDAGASRIVATGSAVEFFNQAVGSVTIAMTDAGSGTPLGAAGIGWSFMITGCDVVRTGVTEAPTGTVTFDGLPLCTYTVTEDANSKIGFTISPATPNNRTVTLHTPGQAGTIGFANEDACTPGCAVEVEAAAATSTADQPGDNQQAADPSPAPSASTTPPPATSPANQATPLPPATGTGATSAHHSDRVFLSGLGLFALTVFMSGASIAHKRSR